MSQFVWLFGIGFFVLLAATAGAIRFYSRGRDAGATGYVKSSDFERALQALRSELKASADRTQAAAAKATAIGERVIAAVTPIDVALRDLSHRIVELEEGASTSIRRLGHLKSSLTAQTPLSELSAGSVDDIRTVDDIRARQDVVEQRTAALDQRLLTVESRFSEEIEHTVDPFRSRLDDIEQRMVAISEQLEAHRQSSEENRRPVGDIRKGLDDLEQRTAAWDQQFLTVQSQLSEAFGRTLGDIRSGLDGLEQQIALLRAAHEQSSEETRRNVDPIRDGLIGLEQRVTAVAEALPQLTQTLDQLRSEIDRAACRVNAQLQPIQDQLTSHGERLSRVETDWADRSRLESSVNSLDRRVAETERRLTSTGNALPNGSEIASSPAHVGDYLAFPSFDKHEAKPANSRDTSGNVGAADASGGAGTSAAPRPLSVPAMPASAERHPDNATQVSSPVRFRYWPVSTVRGNVAIRPLSGAGPTRR